MKLISGGLGMPRILPDVSDLTSLINLFTVVPVLVTAFICHYNGKQSNPFKFCMVEINLRHLPGGLVFNSLALD